MKGTVEINIVQLVAEEVELMETLLRNVDVYVMGHEIEWVHDTAEQTEKDCDMLEEMITKLRDIAHDLKIKIKEA